MSASVPVTIREAVSRRDRNAPLDLPRRIHARDPAWVAPLRAIERHRLAPSNPFLREAELRLFVAERNGNLLGTISALKDKSFERHSGERVACFGYFESVDDPAIASALVERVLEQARQWGADRLRGPRNLTRFENIGITVEGFESAPPFLQSSHPRWYAGLLEAQGFTKHHDELAYESALVDERGRPRAIPEELLAKAAACDVPGLSVRSARWRSMRHDLLDAHRVLNEAHATLPDITPMSRETWLALGRLYLGFMSTELLQLAYVGEKPIGYAVCMPELNEALRAARGRLLPLGWLRMALGLRTIETASFKLMGVVPEYRRRGVHAVLIKNVVEGAQRAGYRRLEASNIDERNLRMRAVLEHLGCTIYRRWRIYERAA